MAWVRVLEVICTKHGQLRCFGTEKRDTRVPGTLLEADGIRSGRLRCLHCRRDGVAESTLRFVTEPVTDEYVIQRRPRIARDRAKLAKWVESCAVQA